MIKDYFAARLCASAVILTAGVSWPVIDLAATSTDIFWTPATSGLDQIHCTASHVSVSPNGAFVALWGIKIDAPRAPAPDLSIARVNCLARHGDMSACVVKSYFTNSSPTDLAWSKNSQFLYMVGPQIDLRRLAAPDFSSTLNEHVLIRSNTTARAIDLAAPRGESALLDDGRSLMAGVDWFQGMYPNAELRNVHVGAGATGAFGLGLDQNNFAARLYSANQSRPLGVSYAWIDEAKVMSINTGLALWQNGDLVPIKPAGLGAPIARGIGVVRDVDREKAIAVFSEDGSITALDGTRRPRIIGKAEARSASVWDYSESADGAVRVGVVSDINRGRALRITIDKTHVVYGCAPPPGHRQATRDRLELGSKDRPLPARLYKIDQPKGLVVFFPGGPGGGIGQDERLRRIRPLLDERYDVLVVAQSGSSGEGLDLISRLSRDGGAALDQDAQVVLQALRSSAFAHYRHRVVFAESFGGMAALAMYAAEPRNKATIDGYVLGAPWLTPRDPQSWAGTRGFGGSNPVAQVQWDKAMVGLDWTAPDDAMRAWARQRVLQLGAGNRLTIIYGEQDPTFKPSDVRANSKARLIPIAYGDHSVTLTSTAFTQALKDSVALYAQ